MHRVYLTCMMTCRLHLEVENLVHCDCKAQERTRARPLFLKIKSKILVYLEVEERDVAVWGRN